MKIVPIKEKTRFDVIKKIEECLEMAKNGSYCNVAIVMVGDDHSVADCWANGSFPYTMVGSLEHLKQEFMRSNIEER